MSWNEPDEDGGSPITGYWVERLDPESGKWVRCNKTPVKDPTYRYTCFYIPWPETEPLLNLYISF